MIFPKLRQAEWFDAKSGTATLAPGRDAAGGGQVVVGKDGAWVHFEPVNFHRIDDVQPPRPGQRRRAAPSSCARAARPVTSSARPRCPRRAMQFRDVAVDVSELGNETMDLYLVFTGANDIKLNFFEAMGQGISPEATPARRASPRRSTATGSTPATR